MTVKTSDADYPCCCCLPKRYSILLMPRKLKSPHKGINDKSSRKLCLFLLLFVLIFYVMGSSAKKQTTTNSSSFVQRLARAVKTGCLVQANQTKGERATRLDNPEIKSKYGKVRGVKVDLGDPDLKPVVKFLGIPYAQPPIGKLRWRKTEAPMKWNGIYDATKMRPICPQPVGKNLPSALLPYWYRSNQFSNENMDEDCLYLNIYVPATFHINDNGQAKFDCNTLPVMVYFHGHTFSEGSGNLYDGSVLASTGNVIVVTFNYRLGILGFLSTMDSNAPGNYGLWDQVAALRWVSENINSFGGNNQRVTAFGSGSGAASIGILMISDKTEGYFTRAILQSGNALSPWAVINQPKKHVKLLAKDPLINCHNSTYSKDIVECLRSKNWRDLIQINVEPRLFNLAFGPVVDGSSGILANRPDVLMSNYELISYEVMIGVVQGEGYGYVRNRLKASTPNRPGTQNNRRTSVPQTVYSRGDFQVDVKRFVDAFYGENHGMIEDLVQFIYTNWNNKDDPYELKQSLMDMYTDRQWVESAVRSAETQVIIHQPVYFYTFYHHPGLETDRSWLKCAHGEEVPLVFGAPFLGRNHSFPYNFTRADRMVSLAVMTYWTNFAHNGNPMSGVKQETRFIVKMANAFKGFNWARYYTGDGQHLEISVKPEVKKQYRAQKVALWRCFVPRQVGEICKDDTPQKGYPTILDDKVYSDILPPAGTSPWVPKNDIKPFPNYSSTSKKSASRDGSGMSLELSITLAVGFVLLFVNIIAFAIVSYQKERDKFKIKKLKAELRSRSRRIYSNGDYKHLNSARSTMESCVEGEADINITEKLVSTQSSSAVLSKEKIKSDQIGHLHIPDGHSFSKSNGALSSGSPVTSPGNVTSGYGLGSEHVSRPQTRGSAHMKMLSPRKGGDGAFDDPPSTSSVADVAFVAPEVVNFDKTGSSRWLYGDKSKQINTNGRKSVPAGEMQPTLPYNNRQLITSSLTPTDGIARFDGAAYKKFSSSGARCRSSLGAPCLAECSSEKYTYGSGTLQPMPLTHKIPETRIDRMDCDDSHFHTLGCRNACSLQNLQPVGRRSDPKKFFTESRLTAKTSHNKDHATFQKTETCPVLPAAAEATGTRANTIFTKL